MISLSTHQSHVETREYIRNKQGNYIYFIYLFILILIFIPFISVLYLGITNKSIFCHKTHNCKEKVNVTEGFIYLYFRILSTVDQTWHVTQKVETRSLMMAHVCRNM
jgi:hypothetical protein